MVRVVAASLVEAHQVRPGEEDRSTVTIATTIITIATTAEDGERIGQTGSRDGPLDCYFLGVQI